MSSLLVEKTGWKGTTAYRASVNGDAIACAVRKTVAEDEAIKRMYSAYAVSGNPPEMAMLANENYIVGIEVDQATFALFYFDSAFRRLQTSVIGARQINGTPCTLAQYVRYNVLVHDGYECMLAQSMAMEASR